MRPTLLQGLGRAAQLAAAVSVVTSLCAPAAAPAAGHDVVCEAKSAPRATVLVLRGGYFSRGDARSSGPMRACRRFASAGLRAVSVDFPNRRYFAALDYIRTVAARERQRAGAEVLAYGESSGGTYAAWLAQEKLVSAAVAVAAPSNLVLWARHDATFWHGVMHMSLLDRRRASPVLGPRSCSRLLLLASPEDEIVPFGQSVSLHRHLAACSSLRRLTGGHVKDPRGLAWAVTWLAAEARTRS
jgi:hypothetical protein